MNTLQLTRHMTPVSSATQSLLKLQSATNKASSDSFAQYLTAHLNSTKAPSYGVASQSSVASQNSVTATSSGQTPDEIAAHLLAANPMPGPQAFQSLSAPMYSGAYMQEVTYNGFVSQANLQNRNAAAEFQLNVSNWALNENQREALGLPSQPPPAAPQYVAVNNAGFQQWWSSLAKVGDPAPVTFFTPIANQQQVAMIPPAKTLS